MHAGCHNGYVHDISPSKTENASYHVGDMPILDSEAPDGYCVCPFHSQLKTTYRCAINRTSDLRDRDCILEAAVFIVRDSDILDI